MPHACIVDIDQMWPCLLSKAIIRLNIMRTKTPIYRQHYPCDHQVTPNCGKYLKIQQRARTTDISAFHMSHIVSMHAENNHEFHDFLYLTSRILYTCGYFIYLPISFQYFIYPLTLIPYNLMSYQYLTYMLQLLVDYL